MTAKTISILVLILMMQLVAVGWHWKSEEQGSTGRMVLALVIFCLIITALVSSPIVRTS